MIEGDSCAYSLLVGDPIGTHDGFVTHVEEIDNASGTVVGYVYRTTTNATLVQGNPLMAVYAVGRLGLRFFETTSNSTIVPLKALPAGYRARACPPDHIIHQGGRPLWQQQEAAYFDGFDVIPPSNYRNAVQNWLDHQMEHFKPLSAFTYPPVKQP